jgi:3-deoxy-manno-octulosonate cytidylyltransferase (CMP-KDO synthetase)
MKFLGIIPARFGSTRLTGKPLMDICGKSMIQRVYERASNCLPDLYVATDDMRISKEVERFGGRAIMTSDKHNSGTNRCLEAYQEIKKQYNADFDVIINVQGDEPLLEIRQIEILKDCFSDKSVMMSTLVLKVRDAADLENESEVFVTFDKNFNSLYFSRSVIPYMKGVPKNQWIEHRDIFKHVGLYGYTPEALKIFAGLPQSTLEITEGLEQNRWLENGYQIRIGITDQSSMCVDTLEDLEKVRRVIKETESE